MYIHLGQDVVVNKKNIIGIFDTDMSTLSPTTRKFLSDAQKKGLVTSAKDEIPKSFILYRDGDEIKVCFSQISSTALGGRKEF